MPILVGESALGDGLPPGLSSAVGEGGSPFEPGREGLGRMAARVAGDGLVPDLGFLKGAAQLCDLVS